MIKLSFARSISFADVLTSVSRSRVPSASAASAALALAGLISARAQDIPVPKTAPSAADKAAGKFDLTRDHVLFEIGYSHLDTEWCWNYPQVINEFIPNTLHENFALFEKYPDYVFNWTGANRYRFMKEYYPEDWATLKKYVAKGQWFPNGSSLEEGDVNSPSPESLIRQIMYGNNYFRHEFGKAGTDYMLPDCFGFPASLPTILTHAGLNGFSTQKLTWGSAIGIPFNFGVWDGVDGTGILAALNGGAYDRQEKEDVSQSPRWYARVDEDGKKSGLFTDYIYYGKGDRGGSAGEGSVPWVQKSIHDSGPLTVLSGDADTLFNIVAPSETVKLPRYKGDLELTEHSAGSLTSQAMMKHWNRRNEILADAAEKASVGAMLLGAQPYPMARITDAWWRFLPGQFHDLMAGTALPKSYEFAYNDQVIALNEFAGVIREGVGGVSRALDTRVDSGGMAIVVYNPLSVDREDLVEATIPGPANAIPRVIGPDGRLAFAQELGREGDKARWLIRAKVPATGYAVYTVPRLTGPQVGFGKMFLDTLSASANGIENGRYRVKLNTDGDVSSIFDKKANQELLSAPMRLAFQYENPGQFPAWNMDFGDQSQPPRAYVDGPAKIEVVENGPVRVAVRVTRTAQGSTFAQTIRLAAGDAGNRVEFVNDIDWKSTESALKAVFPLAVSNPNATYNWGIGTIERGNNYPRRYEAASHQWFDLTGTDGKYGVTVLTDDKTGSDKPDDRTLRLTMIYTPGVRGGYHHQATQDWGRHHIVFGLEGHAGDWRTGDSQGQAARLNQPLMAFSAPSHPGKLGKSFSLASVSTPGVRIEALKRAEESDEVIVRLNELTGKSVNDVRLTMAAPILGVREVDGQERTIAPGVSGTAAPSLRNGALVFNMVGYRPRAFALRLGKPSAALTAPTSAPVTLPFDTAATSSAIGKTDGAFDASGRAIPGELLPSRIESDGVSFHMGETTPGAKNAVACAGQTIKLPAKTAAATRFYFLAAAYGGDTTADFRVDGGKPVTVKVQDWSGYVGQWDTRLWGGHVAELTYNMDNPMIGLVPGFIKRDDIAWYSDHWRLADGKNDPYQFCYLYRYAIDLPVGARTVTLPNNPKIRLFAATVARNPNEETVPAQPLYDTLADHGTNTAPTILPSGGTFHNATSLSIQPALYYTDQSTLHYTIDGSEPNSASPTYRSNLALDQPATVKVRQIGADGSLSPIAEARFEVNDTTAPSLVKADVVTPTTVKIDFSEPVDKATATDKSHFVFEPANDIRNVSLSDDGRSALITVGTEMPRQGSVSVRVSGVQDLSPAHNAVANASQAVTLLNPVFVASRDVQTFAGTGRGDVVRNAPALPTAADAPWTINMFVYTDKEPDELTVIGGFGDATDTAGTQRYLIKFQNGIEFWGSDVDVASGVAFDLGKWQMISATYDGKTVRVYKNGTEIKSQDATLSAAHPEVRVAGRGPWGNRGRLFEGKIANFTIWNQALTPEFLRTMVGTGPK